MLDLFFFFFFQAEDGIRDGRVTGVQTCALPIFGVVVQAVPLNQVARGAVDVDSRSRVKDARNGVAGALVVLHRAAARSEERRVGKECRSRWSPDHEKKKKKGIEEM